jgi:hypothetical protein
VGVLLVDQRERWKLGLEAPVESYLVLADDVAADPRLVLELVNGEIAARRDREQRVDPTDFSSRFPQLARELTGQLSRSDIAVLAETRDVVDAPHDVHPTLSSTVAPAAPTAATLSFEVNGEQQTRTDLTMSAPPGSPAALDGAWDDLGQTVRF